MNAIIKSVKLLEENEKYGLEVTLSTEEGIKKFGTLTDNGSFRKLFFGILSVCNNYDISNLSKTKGKRISVLLEKPNSLNQRIASVGSKSKFLLSDKNDKFITKKFNYKEIKLLKTIGVFQTGTICYIQSASGTVCMMLEFKGYTQGATGPNLYVGMGYPLMSHDLGEEELKFVENYSSSYLAGLIKTILNTKYLYHEKRNKDVYEVECILDEQGNVISIGNTPVIESKDTPVYINKYANEYRLEAHAPIIKKEENKTLKRK